MSINTPTRPIHITVCICTYKRPELLHRLLVEMDNLETDKQFTYSIVVTENDPNESARDVVSEFARSSSLKLTYCVEPRSNIAMARNKALAHAEGDFVAFIDDDEFPQKDWLLQLLRTCDRPEVSGVLGPVLPYFGPGTPKWVIKGKFYDRPLHPTGMKLQWAQTRTGNVLLRRDLVANNPEPFDPRCLEGSDQEFFKRMMNDGKTFIWCNEGIAYEVVPPERWKRNFLIRRAFSRGYFSLRNHGLRLQPVLKSAVAVPAYLAALPISLFLGQARFMRSAFNLSYHTGRLLALVRFNPTGNAYVSK